MNQNQTMSQKLGSIEKRLDSLNWDEIEAALDEQGYAKTQSLLTTAECQDLIRLYADPKLFRSCVDMARFGFGKGQYKYFAEPLPALVASLRTHFYRPLTSIANRWMERLAEGERFPLTLDDYLTQCSQQGQRKPTPLLLSYETGGFNCLHQDLYGELAFPLQVTCVLSQQGREYTGGEFLLCEQRPRAQTRVEAVPIDQGESIIFPNRHRPLQGKRGYYRVNVRHGVSRLRSGLRYSLGIIFHDAK